MLMQGLKQPMLRPQGALGTIRTIGKSRVLVQKGGRGADERGMGDQAVEKRGLTKWLSSWRGENTDRAVVEHGGCLIMIAKCLLSVCCRVVYGVSSET